MSKQRSPWIERAAVGVLSLLAAAVYLIGAGAGANAYYAAAVHSMLMNPHAFAFASFDPVGFVSVDKPPLGLWLQTASAAVFGFSGPSLMFPSAVAELISLLLLWRAVRSTAGVWTGVGAAALFAMTPVVVVIARDNNLDGIMAALCLAAASATLLAVRTGRSGPLLLAGLLLGLAFNVKMVIALLVLPGIVITYGLCAPVGWRRKVATGGAAAFVLFVVSMAWLTFVAMTPASDRPYVGSTQVNSPFELAVSENGLNRMFGGSSSPSIVPSALTSTETQRPASSAAPARSGDPIQAVSAPAVADGPGGTGPLRLLGPEVGGQIGWFLPLALIGLLAQLLLVPWRSLRSHPKGPIPADAAATILWAAWLAAGMLVFSYAHLIEPFYVVAIAPPLAALAAIGARRLVEAYVGGSRIGLLLPVAILATAAEQLVVLSGVPSWLPWLTPLAVVLASLVSAALLGARARAWAGRNCRLLTIGADAATRIRPDLQRLLLVSLVVGLAASPVALWSLDSLRGVEEGGHPFAGPARAGNAQSGLPTAPHRLVAYLVDHAGHDIFLAATLNAAEAIPIELATDRAVMALGGFTGRDPILTPKAFAQHVGAGDVRFVLLPSAQAPAQLLHRLYPDSRKLPPAQAPAQLPGWVIQHCQAVPPPDWSDATISSKTIMSQQLFDCQDARASGSAG